MKRAKSDLIDAFIFHCYTDRLTAPEGSSGEFILAKVADALESILDGVNPDVALGITRRGGSPGDEYTFQLACRIHTQREAGEKWAVIEIVQNEWLSTVGRPAITVTRMKQIYKRHRPKIKEIRDQFTAAQKMQRLTEEQNQKK